MLKQKAKLFASSLLLFENLLFIVAFLVAFKLRNIYLLDRLGPLAPFHNYRWLLVFILPVWSALLFYFQLYESQRTKSLWREIWKIAQLTVCGTFFLMAIVFLFKAEYVSRIFILTFACIAFLFLIIERSVLRSWTRTLRRKGYNTRNIMIIGTGRRAREMQDLLNQHREWGLCLVGFVSDLRENKLGQINDTPIIGTVSELPDLLEKHVIDELVFAVSRKRLEGLEEIFLLCEEQGIRTRVAVNFFPHMIAKVHLDDFHGVPLLTFSTIPHNELLLLAKRVFDLVISIFLLTLLSPALFIIACGIKISSEGPIFFRQKRVGLNGRAFTLFKFRSMCVDAEEQRAELSHLNEMAGPAFKIANDPRATAFGCFLRRFSLDEFPQLYNVLLGHMSIVGPRPPLQEEVSAYKRWQRRRLSMKPGLTCLWQIGGRNKISDFKKWMELDLRYIDNWSLKLDMKIFMKTIFVVLAGRGAS